MSGRALARWIIAAALLLRAASAGARAEPEPFATEEVAPGVFVYAAPIALAGPTNLGAIANLGFVIGRDAAGRPRAYIEHWDITRLPYDGDADPWFDPAWLLAGGR
jgi:hypothetical protein